MRRFYALLLCPLLLGLSAPAQTPPPSGKTANSEIAAPDSAPITTAQGGPVGVIVPRPLLRLPAPQATATPTPQTVVVAVDSALSLPAS